MTDTTRTETPTEATIHATVDALVQALSGADGDAMADCFAPDVTMRTMQGEFRGRDAIRSLLRGLLVDATTITIEEQGVGLLVQQGAQQLTGPQGIIFRWFVGQVDTMLGKDLPAPARPPF
jgi:hypothetical protein